jgi:hypothetical protein
MRKQEMKSQFDEFLNEENKNGLETVKCYSHDEALQVEFGRNAHKDGIVEVIEGVQLKISGKVIQTDYVRPVPQILAGIPFSTHYDMNVLQKVCEMQLVGAETQVLFWCLANCEYYNFINFVPKRIKETLGIGDSQISKIFNKFQKFGVLVKVPKIELPEFVAKRDNWCRINTDLIWKGKLGERASAPVGGRIYGRKKDLESWPSLEDMFRRRRED